MATTNEILSAVGTMRRFIGASQIKCMMDGIRGEEGEFFIQKFLDLAKLVETMPKTYEQDGLGESAVVFLHYFRGSADWWITERDQEAAQWQAFGLADLYGDGGEIGYISIVELIRCGVELDLYWKPKTLGECRKRIRKAVEA